MFALRSLSLTPTFSPLPTFPPPSLSPSYFTPTTTTTTPTATTTATTTTSPPRFSRRFSSREVPLTEQKRVFSGIQPTGTVHLGNYLGAIQQWKRLQETIFVPNNNDAVLHNPNPRGTVSRYHGGGSQLNLRKRGEAMKESEGDSTQGKVEKGAEGSGEKEVFKKCMFSIVDLHSLTTESGRDGLYDNTMNMAAMLLACGIDPKKSILFNQSKVPGHSELMWILSTFTPFNQLNSMVQFKEKSRGSKDSHLGLLSYPVLMAADILLYRATHVPVGDDQTQHLELANKISSRYNRLFHPDFFSPIQSMKMADTSRVLSLTDVSNKMSKSDPLPKSRIDMMDSNDLIAKKIKKAKTDSYEGISYDEAERPELANLIRIFAAVSESTPNAIAKQFATSDMGVFKTELTAALVGHIGPIRDTALALQQNPDYLHDVLNEGAAEAQDIAVETLRHVREATGLV
eukprot:TRINITY_DN7758_c0_g1_i1.p1 TRINITY_DN7758_c0_g1~~TRINITY_DN7758_c0_g1_i1.p1  ORF type:complete len:499 (+),score=120.60 TRINITY_DN7758_c0_g1_i1:125-1498(+)